MPDINHNKIISFLLFSWLVGLFAFSGSTRAADERQVAGQVVLFKGGAFATNQGVSSNLTQGAAIYVGDKILTGGRTRVKLRMIDDTEITLGDDTTFIVTEYRFDAANSSGQGTLGVLKGFFRAVTGGLGKLRDQPFRIQTPIATIGIRGTDFWGEQHTDELRIALIGGNAIVISNNAGSVEINQAGYATRVVSSHLKPETPFKLSKEDLTRAIGTID